MVIIQNLLIRCMVAALLLTCIFLIYRFTWRMKLLTGRRGVGILYAYMLLGLGFLRIVTPDFGDLTSQEQQMEGTFR